MARAGSARRRASARPATCSTGFVRPEGWWGPHHPDSPQGSTRECPVREPCPPKCCYPDMRRSDPTCEAPGTTATIREHQSGGGPAEDGRLNASERPCSRSVIQNRPAVLTGRRQDGTRVGSSMGTLDDGGNMTRRTIGRSLPIRLSTSDNRVSPTRPVAARRRYPDRKGGDGGGGRGAAEQAKAVLSWGGQGLGDEGTPDPKGCRLPPWSRREGRRAALGSLETLGGASRTDRRAGADGVVRHRLGCGGGCREATASSDLPCRGDREPTAGEEPAEAPGPLQIRKTARGPQGDPAERGPDYTRCRWRGVQDAGEPDEVDRWPEPPGPPTATSPTGAHPEVGWPDAAPWHSDNS